MEPESFPTEDICVMESYIFPTEDISRRETDLLCLDREFYFSDYLYRNLSVMESCGFPQDNFCSAKLI